MKYKNIIFFFSLALPLSIILRVIQLKFTIDADTGFFSHTLKNEGILLLYLILFLCFTPAIFAFVTHRSPEHPPKNNVFLSIGSFVMTCGLIYEIFNETFPLNTLGWQILAIKFCGIASVIFFILYGIEGFINKKIPRLLFAIPTSYYIVRIICNFTAVSPLALISDNLILTISYCAVLLFMLYFAELYNKTDSEYNFRKLLASGLASCTLCFTQSVPHLVIKFLGEKSFMHTSLSANIGVFCAGIFILCFIVLHFRKPNIYGSEK